MTREAEAVARGLSKAQRRFILAASARPKNWMSIRRHAKIADNVRVHGVLYPLALVRNGRAFEVSLTTFGLEVRRILQERQP